MRNKVGPPPPPTAGGVTLGARAVPAIAPGGRARRPGRARRQPSSGRGQVYVNPEGGVEEDYPLDAHTRNFLDCIKSRQKPNAEFEIGYYAALPCLLALESLQKGSRSAGIAQARAPARCSDRAPDTPSMKPELRVALLGQGFMGKAHSNAYCQAGHFYDLPYRLRRTLLCGRDAASLRQMADRWGWEETATDWRAAIDRPDIDVVDIALPNHLHAPGGDRRSGGGQDRASARSRSRCRVEEGRAMVAAARRSRPSVWFNYRRVPAIAYARQLIADGRLGQVFHYNAAYRQQWGADTSRAATWRMDPAQAGSGRRRRPA